MKDTFTKFRILSWDLFTVIILKICKTTLFGFCCYCWYVSYQSYGQFLAGDLFFSLTTFKIFFLSLVLSCLIMIFLGAHLEFLSFIILQNDQPVSHPFVQSFSYYLYFFFSRSWIRHIFNVILLSSMSLKSSFYVSSFFLTMDLF